MLYGNYEKKTLWKLDSKFAGLTFETLEVSGHSFATLSPLQLKELEQIEKEKQRQSWTIIWFIHLEGREIERWNSNFIFKK